MNPMKQHVSLSVVVPVYNEEKSIGKLYGEICSALQNPPGDMDIDYEIIFVNDGSKDGTDAVCRALPRITYILLDGHYGQTAAMDAGLHAAKKELIAALDGDGQNDPADIPGMLAEMKKRDLDVISGWRKKREDSFSKIFFSRGAYILRKILLNDAIHDSGCTLKIYKAECFRDFHLVSDQHRFIAELLKNRGYKIGETVVHHRPRTFGRSKYNWKRIPKGFSDMYRIWLDMVKGREDRQAQAAPGYRIREVVTRE